jgi:hypothetical protein
MWSRMTRSIFARSTWALVLALALVGCFGAAAAQAQFGDDSDLDGVPDAIDQCPGTPPGVLVGPDGCTLDGDNDGVLDGIDNCPNVANPDQADWDFDGQGDACDADDDDDGVDDGSDSCPMTPSGQHVASNGCEEFDTDGVPDGADNCPFNDNADQADTDHDGEGDACDFDADGDGFIDEGGDNCPGVYNPDQFDSDFDGQGDACDNDVDGDGVDNSADKCPGTLIGFTVASDGCDDFDGDGVSDVGGDNCPFDSNSDQADHDGDGQGDACDVDDDNDGFDDGADNCPTISNPDQTDTDGNGTGDACQRPQTTVTSRPRWLTNDSTATFVFGSDMPATFRCRLVKDGVGGPFHWCHSPRVYKGLTDGRYIFKVRAVDTAHHFFDLTPARVKFKVDRTPPDTTISKGPTGGATSGPNPLFEFTSTESKSTFECRLVKDGVAGPVQPCTSPLQLDALADGRYKLRVRAVDEAGNRDATPAITAFTVSNV